MADNELDTPVTLEGDDTLESSEVDDILEETDNPSKDDIRKLSNALKKERERKNKLLKELQDYKEIDLEEYRKVKEEKEKTEAQRLKDQEQWKELSNRHEQTLAERNKELAEIKATLAKTKKMSKVKDIFLSSGGKKGVSTTTGRSCFDHVMEAVEGRLEEESDGSIRVVDGQGLQMTNEKGDPMTPSELFKAMAQDPIYSGFFESSVKEGTGINPRSNGRNGSSKETWQEFSKRQGFKGDNKNKTIFN